MKKLMKLITTLFVLILQFFVFEIRPVAEVPADVAAREFGIKTDYKTYVESTNKTIADARKYEAYYKDQADKFYQRADELEKIYHQKEAAEEYRNDAKEALDTAKKYEDQATKLKETLETIDTYIDIYFARLEVGEPITDIIKDAQAEIKTIEEITEELTSKIKKETAEIGIPDEEKPPKPDTKPDISPTPPSGEPAEQPKSPVMTWIRDFFRKMVDSVQNFFRYNPKSPPPTEDPIDLKTLKEFGNRQSDFAKAYQEYVLMKYTFINDAETGLAGNAQAFTDEKMTRWAEDMNYQSDLARILKAFYKTRSDLNALVPKYADSLIRTYDGLGQKAATALKTLIISPEKVTRADIQEASAELIETDVDKEERDALDALFKDVHGFDNPYTTLDIERAAQATVAWAKKVGELVGSQGRAEVANLSQQLVEGDITFKEYQNNLAQVLEQRNPEAYKEDPQQLFHITDAYNLLNNNYTAGAVGRSYLAPEPPSGTIKERFWGSTFIDQALTDIQRDIIEKRKKDQSAAYNQIITQVGNLANQGQAAMKQISEQIS